MRVYLDNLKRLKLADWLVLASIVVAFGPTFYRLATVGWAAADYGHGIFIVPASAWLVLSLMGGLDRSKTVSVSGPALLLAGVLCLVFGAVNAFMFLEAISFILVVLAIAMIRLDAPSLKKIFFPIAYLVFMVPPPLLAIDTLTMPLKTIASQGSYHLLKLAGLPVSLSGAILRVGDYDFFVADACSGYRSMVTLVALAAFYAYLQRATIARKWVIFLSVIPLGIAANVFRIFLTGCLGHFVGIKYAEGFFHEFSGALVFLIAVLGLIIISDRLTRAHAR